MTNPRDLERAEASSSVPDERRGQRPPSGTSLRDDAFAVVIGINEYHDPKIRNLQCARADAQAVYDVLTDPDVGRFKPENVVLLLDSDATERRIRSALGTQLPRRASKNGTVVIYYAGHGAPVIAPGAGSDGIAKYLVPHDAVADDLESSAIPMSKIQEYFQRLATTQVVCFLDSCYSGGAGGRSFEFGDVQFRAALTDEFLDSLANSGRFVVTSCATNEVSLESNALGHGVFTYYLVKGLQGAADTDEDGKVTIDELYTYVYNHVEREARALGGSMNPLRKGSVQGTVYLTEFESAEQRTMRQAREEAERQQKERAREEELNPRRKQLLALSNSNAITMREFNEAMTLLELEPSAMGSRERSLRRYLDSLLSGELSVRAYRQSSALLEPDGAVHGASAPASAPRPPELVAPARPAPQTTTPPRSTPPQPQALADAREPTESAGPGTWILRAAVALIAVVAVYLFDKREPTAQKELLITPPAVSSDSSASPGGEPSGANSAITQAWASLATTPSCDPTESHSYVPGAVRDHACRFMKSLSMSSLQSLAGVPIFVRGPHARDALNLRSYRFGHYNPKFVIWATENLVPVADQLPAPLRRELREAATRYYQVNQWLQEHPDVLRRVSVAYARSVDAAPADPRPGQEVVEGPATAVLYTNQELRAATGDDWDKTIAAGFWIRRNLDETRPLFAEGLARLLTAVDPTFKR